MKNMKKIKYKYGKCQPVWKCCREIRIQLPNDLNEIYEGFNTITNENEKWKLICKKTNYNYNIMQKIL
jgi:hypothetical protein